MIRRQARLGRVCFHRLLSDGRVIANRYAFRLGRTLYSELPSRLSGREWDSVGLGGTAYVKLFEMVIGEGICRVDTGLGSYDNKELLGGRVTRVGTWRVVPGRWRSRLKSKVFLLAGDWIKIVYHKIWYRRLVPRLPLWISRTQSRYWLRFEA